MSSTDYLTDRLTQTITIDIDSSGTGSLADQYMFREQRDRDVTTENRYGNRTRTNDSVIWSGSYDRLNTSAYRGEDVDFTIETKPIDAQTYTQTGEVDSHPIGGYDPVGSVTYTLTGTIIENSPRCLPTSGVAEFTSYYVDDDRNFFRGKTTVTKEPGDSYWLVHQASLEGQTIEEYLVHAIDITFYCEMADLQ